MFRSFVVLAVAVSLGSGCGKKKSGIASLTRADGPVERERGGVWEGASIGTWFFPGDAARTGDGSAELTVAGTQLIRMDPHSVVRFATGSSSKPNIRVELGAFDVFNSGAAGIEIGSVKLAPGGKVHITASKVELLIGAAQVQNADGALIDLEFGSPRSLDNGRVEIVRSDASVPRDASVPPDSAPTSSAPSDEVVEYELTGLGAEQSVHGERWTAIAPGKGSVSLGTKLRLAKSGAKLVLRGKQGGVSLELSGASSQVLVQENLLLGLELGIATATVPAATKGAMEVPGGRVEINAPATAGGQARVEVNAKGESSVAAVHGGAKLVTSTTSLEIVTGETATMARGGAIRPGVVVPRQFDVQVAVGKDPSALWIHDVKGSTAVQFAWSSACSGGGRIEADRDPRFRTPRISEGEGSANLQLTAGAWNWRLRCGETTSNGRVSIVRDSGRRPLPPNPSKNTIDADGRNYTIAYQSLIPVVAVRFKGTGSSFRLHVAGSGGDRVFEADSPTVEIPSGKLAEGNYALWFERDGVKQDKITTLKIAFDQTAAQVYIESPVDGQPFGEEIYLAGAALSGWTAAVEGIEIPVIETATRRFRARVPRPRGGAQALAIRLSHPQLGTHYYLRRETPDSAAR